MKKIIYVVLAALMLYFFNYSWMGIAIDNEFVDIQREYGILEYDLSENELGDYSKFDAERINPYSIAVIDAISEVPVSDSDNSGAESSDDVSSGGAHITEIQALRTRGDGKWTRLKIYIDDGTGYGRCYYAYSETEFIFSDGVDRVIRQGDEITFEYRVDIYGERILTQVVDNRDYDTVVQSVAELKSQVKSAKTHVVTSVILRSLPSIAIEIGVLVGLYFVLKKLKSNPERSWKLVYVLSSLLVFLVIKVFLFLSYTQFSLSYYGNRFLCTVKDALHATLLSNTITVPLFLVIASVVFVVISLKKKDKLVVGLILFVISLVLIGVLVLSVRAYIQKAKNAATTVRAHAPIIYLYDENDEDELINVMLDLDGELDVTYPLYDESCGWTVTASSDGVLEDEDGNSYPFLFWEATLNMDYDLSRGFCVRGSDTEVFLNEALAELGLNERETADFMSYWLPLMEDSEYNVITFQTGAYEDAAGLIVTPAPDVTVRINMLWYESSDYVDLPPQDLESMNPCLADRSGLTLVEWGGEVIAEPA